MRGQAPAAGVRRRHVEAHRWSDFNLGSPNLNGSGQALGGAPPPRPLLWERGHCQSKRPPFYYPTPRRSRRRQQRQSARRGSDDSAVPGAGSGVPSHNAPSGQHKHL